MTVIAIGTVIQTQMWPQRDARDPLGLWGGLVTAVGDVSGGIIDIFIQAPAGIRAAYVYNCVSCHAAKIDGTAVVINIKRRLISHWPDIDPTVGVQSFEDVIILTSLGSTVFTDPRSLPGPMIVSPEDKILIFDPRPNIAAAMTLLEFQFGENEDASNYRAQAYGYFWDRQVMETPGGPRFPGST